MEFWELLLVALSVSMDAFAVAVCKGLALGRIRLRHAATVGIWFGGFQALMPLAGFLLASIFSGMIEAVDHWVAFALLALIGANMIKESFETEEECCCDPDIGVKVMLPLAVATSIDALAVGVTFAFLEVKIIPAVCLIGLFTMLLSAIGVKLGSIVGGRFRHLAERFGGIVLVFMGAKILLEGLGAL